MIRRTLIGALAMALGALAAPALAQDAWPTKPVKIISPFPAGATIGTLRAADTAGIKPE